MSFLLWLFLVFSLMAPTTSYASSSLCADFLRNPELGPFQVYGSIRAMNALGRREVVITLNSMELGGVENALGAKVGSSRQFQF